MKFYIMTLIYIFDIYFAKTSAYLKSVLMKSKNVVVHKNKFILNLKHLKKSPYGHLFLV